MPCWRTTWRLPRRPRRCSFPASSASKSRARSVRPGLSGSGLYNALGRAGTHRTARPSLCRLPALHGTSGGATMTIPGGTRTTLWTARVQFPTRARPTGFYHGVGAPTGPLYGALALRSAHPDAAGVVICTLGPQTPNSVQYPSGAPGPIRAARGGLSRCRELRLYGVFRRSFELALLPVAGTVAQPRPHGGGADRNTGGPRLVGPVRLRPPDGRLGYRSREVGKNHLLVGGNGLGRPAAHDLDPAEPRCCRRSLLALPGRLAARSSGDDLGGRLAEPPPRRLLLRVFGRRSRRPACQAGQTGAETLLETGHRCRHGPRRHRPIRDLAPRAQPGGIGGNRLQARPPHEAGSADLRACAQRDKLLAAKPRAVRSSPRGRADPGAWGLRGYGLLDEPTPRHRG